MKTIQQHMQLSQQQRQSHINKNSDCYGHVIKQGPRKGQLSSDPAYSKKSLLDFHQIEYFRSRKIHTCHLCLNNSQAPRGFVCINPEHLYFGTPSENEFDKPESVRKAATSKAGKSPASEKSKKISSKNASETQKKLFKEGRHISQQLQTCPHCGLEGKGAVMKRWHFDNCKQKNRPQN